MVKKDVKSTVVGSKKARAKKCEIQGGSQEMAVHDGRLMVKNLIIAIQVNTCCLLQVSLGFSTRIIIINFFCH